MRYPDLVRQQDCKTQISIHLHADGIDEDGAPIEGATITTLCNYQGNSRKYYNEKHQLVELSGTALLRGDIAPELNEITGGTAEIFNETRRIYRATKARNPDGSVNYTKLELV